MVRMAAMIAMGVAAMGMVMVYVVVGRLVELHTCEF
jgi:Ni/Fe-hydrogenase subunit HybB-like protein